MTLVITKLQSDINKAFNDAYDKNNVAPEAARKTLADALALAIDTYIKTGTVVTTGTAATQTGTIS